MQTVLQFVVQQVQWCNSSILTNGDASNGPNEAHALLRKFEFTCSHWNERVSILSGGEHHCLQIMLVISQQPYVLIMDEPSVDLDLNTLQALETYLQEFDGILLIVSHDWVFADKVMDHLFIFEGNGKV